jgi:2-polyprenyl-3-methyl-5-hydroxy-6-metoxy-1,4-benzoquinol methylase
MAAESDRVRNSSYLRQQYWGGKLRWASLINPRIAITLDTKNSFNRREFHIYGIRLLGRKMERFLKYGMAPPSRSQIVEIGCGVGRFTLPMAGMFEQVHAVDMSSRILRAAKRYCRSVPNVSYYQNDGFTLEAIPGETMGYALCTGVLQHVPEFDIITGYVREALRTLKESGLFLFTFQGHYEHKAGSKRKGAKVTAAGLDRGLAGAPYEILELSTDPGDPTPHFLALIRKNSSAPADRKSFVNFPLVEAPYRTGTFEDLPSCEKMIEALKGPRPRVTFYDPG